MASTDRQSLKYVPALDGIRGAAILFAFLFHVGILQGGWVGVDMFFTLSGYLITLILLTEYDFSGYISVRNFFFRRACRLLPAVILLICTALALSFYFADDLSDTKVDAIAALLYVEDFRYAFAPVTGTSLGHLWSLSVEEQFYLIWPFFLILSLSLLGRKRMFYVVIGIILAVIVWRFVVLSESQGPPYYRIYFSFDTRIDGLLIGSALALWGYRPGQPVLGATKFLWPFIIIFFIIILTKLDPLKNSESVSSYPLIGAATAGLIVIVTAQEKTFLSKVMTFAPLVALGQISYGFYLWHYLIIHEAVTRGITKHVAPLTFGATLVVSIGSYCLVERPILRLGRKAFSVNPSSLAPARSNIIGSAMINLEAAQAAASTRHAGPTFPQDDRTA